MGSHTFGPMDCIVSSRHRYTERMVGNTCSGFVLGVMDVSEWLYMSVGKMNVIQTTADQGSLYIIPVELLEYLDTEEYHFIVNHVSIEYEMRTDIQNGNPPGLYLHLTCNLPTEGVIRKYRHALCVSTTELSSERYPGMLLKTHIKDIVRKMISMCR